MTSKVPELAEGGGRGDVSLHVRGSGLIDYWRGRTRVRGVRPFTGNAASRRRRGRRQS